MEPPASMAHVSWRPSMEESLPPQDTLVVEMATPGEFPSVTADWVHSRDFDLIFGPSRYRLREEICATSSAQTLILR